MNARHLFGRDGRAMFFVFAPKQNLLRLVKHCDLIDLLYIYRRGMVAVAVVPLNETKSRAARPLFRRMKLAQCVETANV